MRIPDADEVDRCAWPFLLAVAFDALLLSLVCQGCTPVGETQPPVVSPLALDPAPELADMVADAADRWEAATGTEVLLYSGGVPVIVDPELGTCGETMFWRNDQTEAFDRFVKISLRTDCQHMVPVMHEVGHAVCAYLGVGVYSCHAPTGVMKYRYEGEPGGDLITDDTLTEVCSHRACTSFEPETQ